MNATWHSCKHLKNLEDLLWISSNATIEGSGRANIIATPCLNSLLLQSFQLHPPTIQDCPLSVEGWQLPGKADTVSHLPFCASFLIPHKVLDIHFIGTESIQNIYHFHWLPKICRDAPIHITSFKMGWVCTSWLPTHCLYGIQSSQGQRTWHTSGSTTWLLVKKLARCVLKGWTHWFLWISPFKKVETLRT